VVPTLPGTRPHRSGEKEKKKETKGVPKKEGKIPAVSERQAGVNQQNKEGESDGPGSRCKVGVKGPREGREE